MQCLGNDLVRRLVNTKEQLPNDLRSEVVDRYGVKLLSSGYGREQTKKILVSGIKGYMVRKDRRSKSGIGGGRLHRTAEETSKGRIMKKLLSKSSWYRSKRKDGMEHQSVQSGAKGTKREPCKKTSWSTLKTRAVLFVEQTPFGELAVRVREQLQRLEPTLGYKVRVVERTGTSISSMFAQSSIWGGEECGRSECVTCTQMVEDRPDCTRVGVVYESICYKCNPSSLEKGLLKTQETNAPSLYVGETSRSIQERAIEHWGAAKKNDDKSHMVRHQALEHPGEQPTFVFKVVSSHRTALNRQIREAVRIRRRGGAASILNSKSEFNRCQIPRLVVEVEDEETRLRRLEKEKLDQEETLGALDREHSSWRQKKTRELQLLDSKRRRHSEGEEDIRTWGARRRPKKLKFATIDEDWGEEVSSGEDQSEEQPTPDCDLGCPVGEQMNVSRCSKPSLITDYYSTRPTAMEQIKWDEDGEGAWWEEETLLWTGLRGVRYSGVVTNLLEIDQGRTEHDERLVGDDLNLSPDPLLEVTTPPPVRVGERTTPPRDGDEEPETGLHDDSTSALWGDSGDERFMEQETDAFLEVTSLNSDGMMSQTQLEVGGMEARSLTMMSKDDCDKKTTLVKKEGQGEITDFRDGQDHLRDMTRPTSEEGGGCKPTYQPTKGWWRKGGVKPPTVAPITIPIREVIDSTVAESTAIQAKGTELKAIRRDGPFARNPPVSRRPVKEMVRMLEERGRMIDEQPGGARSAVIPRIVQDEQNDESQATTSPTPSVVAVSLPGNAASITPTNISVLVSDAARPANQMRGGPSEETRPANDVQGGATDVLDLSGGDALLDTTPRRANDRSDPGSASNQRGGELRLSASTRRCVFAKGGVCAKHGPGAKLKWRPIPRGDGDGWTKEYYYACDLSRNDKKMKQTRLSFSDMTSPRVGSIRSQRGSL